MRTVDTLRQIGFYCGRFDDGFWGEPQNALSNGAFLLAAWLAFRAWRRTGEHDLAQLTLIVMGGAIGVGSFLFHTQPNPTTLMLDLIPIQVFGLFGFFYLGVRHFGSSKLAVLAAVVAFFLVRQAWIALVPLLVLGGGSTHIPTILLLAASGWALRARGDPVGRRLLLACVSYAAALTVRAFDIPLCGEFPFGLHWAWHLLNGLTVGIVLHAIACQRIPRRREKLYF